MKKIRIEDKDNTGALLFDLKDIIMECESYKDRRWFLSNLYFFGAPEWAKFFSNRGDESIEISFDQLKNYSLSVEQTIDGIFMALKRNVSNVHILDSNLEISKFADLIIRAHDSSFFEVITDDENLIRKLQKKFKTVCITEERSVSFPEI